jgi:hypothetical protein
MEKYVGNSGNGGSGEKGNGEHHRVKIWTNLPTPGISGELIEVAGNLNEGYMSMERLYRDASRASLPVIL